jgi:hypothetical protein
MADASLKQIADFFRKDGETLSQFAEQWKALSDKDKTDIKAGIGDGSLTY